MQVAETLASSAALDDGNLSDFYREATRIVAARPLWETAALTKPDQEQVLNVLRPLGAPLGPVTDTESFNAVLRTRKPVLGGLGSVPGRDRQAAGVAACAGDQGW